MEVSGTVIPRSIGFRWGARDAFPFSGNNRCESPRRVTVAVRPWADESHRLYYAPPARCGAVGNEKRKEVKRGGNLVTEISMGLAALYSAGLVVDGDEGMLDEIRGERIMEAAEFLLTQLKQKKAKEKEMKKKKKVVLKAAMKAAKMRNCAEDSSSSSSSESSDNECEEVVEMNGLTTTDLEKAKLDPSAAPDQSPECRQELLSIQVEANEKAELNHAALKLDRECSSSNGISSAAVARCSGSVVAVEKPLDKIEVCMGGKCKKAGARELLQEFEKKVGTEAAVVGCKCMGKCKQGPNVRVVNHDSLQDDLFKVAKEPLCIGVGLEDVSSIVANFLVEKDDIGMGLLIA